DEKRLQAGAPACAPSMVTPTNRAERPMNVSKVSVIRNDVAAQVRRPFVGCIGDQGHEISPPSPSWIVADGRGFRSPRNRAGTTRSLRQWHSGLPVAGAIRQ